uniref:AB hydrolase-1 domain-containing protein n=1 Tax=Strongyloides venezuelensis TaxID=75913 RepID=A0A0K0FV95_STRVS
MAAKEKNISYEEETKLYNVDITLTKNEQKPIKIKSVYQDSMPEGSKIGTVVALHGAPGSHNDFKYIEPLLTQNGIRTIAINFPGFGISESLEDIEYTNDERIECVEKTLKAIDIEENVILMGHSRGTENALRMATMFPKMVIGALLVNPIGLRPHRGMRPRWISIFLAILWRWGLFKPFIVTIIKFMYEFCGIKINNTSVIEACLLTIDQINFHEQKEYIDKLKNLNITIINAIGGKDPVIERSVSREFYSSFPNNLSLEFSNEENEEDKMIKYVRYCLKNGEKTVTSIFSKDGHFLQKHKAKFLAETARVIFDIYSQESNNDFVTIKN